MSANAAVGVLAAAVAGIAQAHGSVDPEVADVSMDLVPVGEHGLAAEVTLATGDRYRIVVEWLREESP